MTWNTDPQAEELMQKLELAWTVREVSLESIDWIASELNGGRTHDPLIPEAIERYEMARRNGASFPMPVLHQNGEKSPWIMSGNQRLNAEKRIDPKAKVTCYIVDSSDTHTINAFVRVANICNGEPLSQKDRMELAITCVRTNGWNVEDASKFFLVSTTTIKEHIRAADTRTSLDRAKVPNVEVLKHSHLTALARIKDPSAQVKLGTLATRHMPTGERLNQVAAMLDSADTPTEKARVVKEFESELRRNVEVHAEQKQAIRRPRRDRLVSLLSTLANFLDKGLDGGGFTEISQVQCEREKDADQIRKLWKRVNVRMKTILE